MSDKIYEKMQFARGLYALVDDAVAPHFSMQEKARWLIDLGVPVLQLRMENTSLREALGVCHDVAKMARRSTTKIMVNDSVDLALATDVDGVHLGRNDLPLSIARELLPYKIIGATARTLSAINAAKADGADYVGVGPVFSTQTKDVTHLDLLGLDAVAGLAQKTSLPIVAIGGLTLAHANFIAHSAVYSMAVASDLFASGSNPDSMRSRTAAYLKAFCKP